MPTGLVPKLEAAAVFGRPAGFARRPCQL